MTYDIKRLNYFTGQFLDATDFKTEQAYHIDARRRNNKILRGPGILEGLEVSGAINATEFSVGVGTAVDSEGREIILSANGAASITWPIPADLNGTVDVVISYKEVPTDKHTSSGDLNDYTGDTRWQETWQIDFMPQPAPTNQIILASLTLHAGHIDGIDVGDTGVVPAIDLSTRTLSPILLGAGHTLRSNGRMYVYGEETLYLLNRNGVTVGKESGGNGNLIVEGEICQNQLHMSGGVGGSSLSYNAHRNDVNSDWVFPDPTRSAVTLEIDDRGGNGKGRFDVYTTSTSNKTGWVNRLRIDGDSGNVGIGTTAPTAKLEVNLINPNPNVWAGNTKALRLLSPDNGYYLDVNTYVIAGGNVGYHFSPNATTGLVISTPGNIGIGTTAPKSKLHVVGPGLISDGDGYAVPNNKMASGSLTIGSTSSNFGGGSNWNSNTAGLLMETLDNTEIAIHDSGTRLASVVQYQGASNSLTIGRDMGFGHIALVAIAGDATIAGNASVGSNPIHFTSVWNGFPDLPRITNAAEISNDTSTYQTLMIVGNRSAGLGRRVSVWDRLEVNGSLLVTNDFKLGNGTKFNMFQSGTESIGPSTTHSFLLRIYFLSQFPSIPKVIVTVQTEPGQNFTDVFAVTTKNIDTLEFSVTVMRVDTSTGGWGQQLKLDWFACS